MPARIFPRLICLFVCVFFFLRSDEVLPADITSVVIFKRRSLELLFYFSWYSAFLNVIVIFDRWVILQRPDNNSDPFDPKGKLHFHFIFFYLCFSVLGSQGGRGGGGGWERIAPLYKCPHMACIFFNYNHPRLVKFWPVIPLHFNESTLLLFVARILYSSNVLQSLAIH